MPSSRRLLSLVVDVVAENDYLVIASSSMGEARTRITLPFDTESMENTLAQLERGDDAPRLSKEIGIKLYQAIFGGELGALLAANRATLEPNESLNLTLQFNDQAVHIARLPWELLHDGTRFLVSSGWINLTRYINLPQNVPTTTVALPFRVLVIISRPLGVPPLDNTSERNAILKGLSSLENTDNLIVDFLRPATHDHLVELLSTQEYDAIHFDGHGAFIEGNGYLVFENEYAEKDLVSAETLSNTLSRTNTKLIVLSACQSASVNGSSVFASVAPALILAGIPAVVAMQFSIPVRSAVKFAQQFYTSIANFDGISHAVMQGRKTLFPEKGAWFIPVLYLRSRSDVLFTKGRKALKSILKSEVNIPKSPRIPEIPYFVGREKDFARLAEAASSSQSNIVVVWGAGGIGKSTLVSEFIQRQDWRFRDGVLWISLIGGKSIDTILDEIAFFFTAKNLGSVPFPEKLEATITLLDGKDVVIVFDNFEELESDSGIHELIVKLPNSIKVLITSRIHPVTAGWQSIELYKLSDSEMLEFFFKIGRDLGTKIAGTQDFTTIKEICELLDGHPLALKLIMPMTISTPLSRILSDLKRQPVRGIASALDTSYNVIGKEERTLLTRISIFDSGFDEQAIEAIGKLENWQGIKDELVRRSFVHFDGTEFIIHPVIRQYVYEKLDNKKSCHLLAADHFQTTRNYFLMVDHLYHAEEWGKVIDIMHQLTAPLYMRQLPNLGELMRRLGIALSAAQKAADPKTIAMIEGDLGNVYNQNGRYEEALSRFRNAYQYGKDKGDLHWQSQGLSFLATTFVRMGRDQEAIAHQIESVELAKKLHDDDLLAFSLSVLGDVYFMLNRFGPSAKKEGEANSEKANDERLRKAIAAYEEALELFQKTGQSDRMAQPYTNLGSIYSILENYAKAAEYLEKSIAIKLKQGDVYGLVASSLNISNVYEELGDHAKAKMHIDAVISMHRDGLISVKQLLSMAYARRGGLNCEMEQIESAISDYALACLFALEDGQEKLFEAIRKVEKQVDKLLENGKANEAIKLCSAIIDVWQKKELTKIAPELVDRLAKKRQHALEQQQNSLG